MIYGKERERVIILGRYEHEILIVRAGAQRLSWSIEVSELRIADLQDARQGKTFFIHVFSVRTGARLARYDFHAVFRFHGIEIRNLVIIKKPTPPRPVFRIGAMQSRKINRIRTV